MSKDKTVEDAFIAERPLDAGTAYTHHANYSEQLKLEQLLGAVQPWSDKHDHMLFVIIHQASELWMKLVLFELDAAKALVGSDELLKAIKVLHRITRIQENLTQSWSILATMTPNEFLAFRDSLGDASGFQSLQYRLIEFGLGNKSVHSITPHGHDAKLVGRLRAALEAPSLYDDVLALLARRGFAIDAAHMQRDVTAPYLPHPSVEKAWADIYHDVDAHYELYLLAEKLVDVEHAFHRWRFDHMKTVERLIGFRRGTGGSSGVGFLRKALDLRFFPELWSVRTEL